MILELFRPLASSGGAFPGVRAQGLRREERRRCDWRTSAVRKSSAANRTRWHITDAERHVVREIGVALHLRGLDNLEVIRSLADRVDEREWHLELCNSYS